MLTVKIVLNKNYNFEQAIEDLNGFDYIWLIWWFNKNSTWKPKVRPPRGPSVKRGLFSTRSPHRPNPIGLTAVPLISIEKNIIYVGTNDLINETPILDIKPYLASADSFPTASLGWLEEIEKNNNCSQYKMERSEEFKKQEKWLIENNILVLNRVKKLLLIDPKPNKTRRIKEENNGLYRISCGAWRVFFTTTNNTIKLLKVNVGYPTSALKNSEYNKIPHKKEQLNFLDTFKD